MAGLSAAFSALSEEERSAVTMQVLSQFPNGINMGATAQLAVLTGQNPHDLLGQQIGISYQAALDASEILGQIADKREAGIPLSDDEVWLLEFAGLSAFAARNSSALLEWSRAAKNPRFQRLVGELDGASGVSLGGNHPLGADAIPRNGSRPLDGQGPGTVTCGHNSCGMVLDTLGNPIDPATLIDSLPPRSGGINRIDVRNLFAAHGVNASTFAGKNIGDLARYTSNGTPVVVRISGQNNFSHFVVVDGVTTRNGMRVVAIRDPAGAGVQYFSPASTFGQHFTGEVIVPQ